MRSAVLASGAQRATRWFVLAFALAVHCAMPAGANNPVTNAGLPRIGPAPEFTLTDQDGRRFSARDLRGRVAVVTFIFTTCSAACPMLTAKLVGMQRQLGRDQTKVFFAAVTVDPLNDKPEVLKKYAQAHSADLARFAFLTGSLKDIEDLTRRYAVYQKRMSGGSVDHTFLTSIIDRDGMLRVQYLGTRFDTVEFLADLRLLLAEGHSK